MRFLRGLELLLFVSCAILLVASAMTPDTSDALFMLVVASIFLACALWSLFATRKAAAGPAEEAFKAKYPRGPGGKRLYPISKTVTLSREQLKRLNIQRRMSKRPALSPEGFRNAVVAAPAPSGNSQNDWLLYFLMYNATDTREHCHRDDIGTGIVIDNKVGGGTFGGAGATSSWTDAPISLGAADDKAVSQGVAVVAGVAIGSSVAASSYNGERDEEERNRQTAITAATPLAFASEEYRGNESASPSRHESSSRYDNAYDAPSSTPSYESSSSSSSSSSYDSGGGSSYSGGDSGGGGGGGGGD